MARKFVDQHRFHELAGRGEAAGVGLTRVSASVPKVFKNGSRRIRFCFSDGRVDLMGDTISPHGWELSGFLKNPVALWSHLADEPPIGRASNISVEGDRLMGTIEFAPPDVYPFAETIYRMVRERFINAVSVGFVPIEYSFSTDRDRPHGIDFKRQTLLEISVCPVPANPGALAEARAKGIDLSSLDDWADRAATIERLRGPRPAAAQLSVFESVAGCAIDHQRERHRREQRERIEREIRLIRLGPVPESTAARQFQADRLAELNAAAQAWK